VEGVGESRAKQSSQFRLVAARELSQWGLGAKEPLCER